MNIELSNQAQAALSYDGPILVLGGPGSGKTTLALLKAQQLTPTLFPGQEVLFLSFSRAAVRQVLTRCRDILTSDEQKLINVKTYHAFCLDLIKSHGRLLTGKAARIAYPAAAKLAKSAYDGDWEIEQERLAREESIYCFDQFAPASVEILSRADRVLELISQSYPLIILDEFQDTDDSQWKLVKLLSRYSCLVTLADPDQRIFEYETKVDPERLNYLRSFLHPAEFDLGTANHRSPDTSILSFADAVLRNQVLPPSSDVTVVSYWNKTFKQVVHANVWQTYINLSKQGIISPTVAVLCKSNPLVADVSALLNESHSLNGTNYAAVDHHVVWDAELTTAAAQVVASILEWPQHDFENGVASTLRYIADYYDLKNAERPNKTALTTASRFRRAETAVRNGRTPQLDTAKKLVSAFRIGVKLIGRPENDWLLARNIVAGIPKLNEVFTNARFIRLFRATDEIGGMLSKEWLASGLYTKAAERVRRTLEARQLISANIEPAGVILMTMHKAKGKEFDAVVVIEGQYRATFFGDSREQEPFEASRRLLRVAITRARHEVCIVRPRGVRPLTDF